MSSRKKRVLHVAGIVPIAAPPLDFNLPWNDCLMPVAPDYTAVERAVYECALAGCETIWVVGHLGSQPLIKKRIGEFIADPVSLTIGLNPSLCRKEIPIYYVSIRPKDRDVRDCLAWSVLYGADTAFRVSARLSVWLKPLKYYCAFPYGIMPEETIKENRDRIGSLEKTMFSFKGKTIKDGLHISFTFDEKDYKTARDLFIKKETEVWTSRLFGKKYKLEEVFCNLNLDKKTTINIPWFYDISSWDSYKKFLSSEKSAEISKKKECYLTAKKTVFPTMEEVRKLKGVNRQLRKEEYRAIQEANEQE